MRKWEVISSRTTSDLTAALNELEAQYWEITIHAQGVGTLTGEFDQPLLITTVSFLEEPPEEKR